MPFKPHPLLQAGVRVLFAVLLAAVWWLDRRDRAGEPASSDAPLAFHLEEASRSIGIDFRHVPCRIDPKVDNAAPHITAMGAAVSVADVDGDGWMDLYATSSGSGSPNALFRNRGDGTFADVAAAAGAADLNRAGEGASMGSIWGDVDNDGDEDLFVYKWGWQQLLRNDTEGVGSARRIRFTDISAEAGVQRWMNANAAVFLDYDRDGDLDLYVAGYFSERFDLWNLETTRIMQESFEFAENGGHKLLLRNVRAGAGGARFEDVTEQAGCDSTRWTLAVASADMDGDGWPDLYLANDYGTEQLFLNRAGRRFEEVGRQVGLAESSKSGMSATLGDFENNGSFGAYVTNISKSGFLFQGNNLRANRLKENGRLVNIADVSSLRSRAVVDCGWAWGAQFGDLDNDGLLDLVVVNGFISASRGSDYWYDMSKIAGGAGGVFQDARNWPPIGDKSLSGYERSCVLHNRGRSQFVDVAERCGATDLFDGRAVALADLWNRGALDAIVANQNGPLLVYRNEVEPERGWIQFLLRGTSSNRSAIGAELTLTFEGKVQVQSVQGGSGFCAQNDRRLHFGLGPSETIERAVIRWPSGREQVLAGLEPRRLHVIEEPRQP